MPGPPPPPPGAPPPACPPPPPNFLTNSTGDGRGALLQSIRHGAKLKKTVTNDRSNPIIGKVTNSNNNVKSGQISQVPNGLGGLFASGIPKLRPTGIPLGDHRDDSNENNYNSNNTTKSPQKFTSLQLDVQNALKKQMADNNRNRGPPPPAPVRLINSSENLQPLRQGNSNGTRKLTASQSAFPQFERSPTAPQPNVSTLHRKANSNVNLPSLENQSNGVPARPNNRKPNLAPKPPVLNCTVNNKKQSNGRPMSGDNGTGITRANSMKNPRPRTPEAYSPEDYSKFGTVRNLSTLIDRSLSASTNSVQQRLKSTSSTPRPPHVPPPPPSKTGNMRPPNHAPPPPPCVGNIPQPPSHAPPPPPHRTAPNRVAQTIMNAPAPPPPPRHSSMKEGQQGRRTVPVDLDVKFADRFRESVDFPRPPLYRGLLKVYLSKTVGNKQQAPPPPIHHGSRLLDSC